MTVQVGTEITPWELRSVSAEKMKTMAALLDDSNPIHFDVEALRALGMGERPINQGPSNLSYIMNMLSDWAGGHDKVCRVKVRFMDNVRAEDHVIARGTVTALNEVDGRLLAECEVRLAIKDGPVALAGEATVDVSVLAGGPAAER